MVRKLSAAYATSTHGVRDELHPTFRSCRFRKAAAAITEICRCLRRTRATRSLTTSGFHAGKPPGSRRSLLADRGFESVVQRGETNWKLARLRKTGTDDFLPEWYLNSVFIPYHRDF